jgi:hypothetical protein
MTQREKMLYESLTNTPTMRQCALQCAAVWAVIGLMILLGACL